MVNHNNLIIKPKKPKAPKGEDGHKVFSVRIQDDTVGRLDEISVQTGRSRNELVNMLLEFALDNCKVDKETGIENK